MKGPIQKIKKTYKSGGNIGKSPVQLRNCIQNDTAILLLERLKLGKQNLKLPNTGEDAEPVKTHTSLLGKRNGTAPLRPVRHLLINDLTPRNPSELKTVLIPKPAFAIIPEPENGLGVLRQMRDSTT